MTTIRLYQPSDKEDCIRIFNSNVPKFFDQTELLPFHNWLDARAANEIAYSHSVVDHYYVLLSEDKIIACAGFYILKSDQRANLAWGMVDSAYHRKGFGKEITRFRLQEIKKLYPGSPVRMDTSQHTWTFYKEFGFALKEVVENAFAPGLHKHVMELPVNL